MIFMLPMLLSSGGNDLMGYLPTDAYWQQRGVTVSPQALISIVKTEKPSDITGLMQDLGSPEFAKRQAAQEKILAMGPAALPQIAPKVNDADPEVAERAKAIVQQLTARKQGGAADKLMAIRALGEMKSKEALPVLAPLTASKEPFVADYAARAIAAIEGKPAPIANVPAEELAKDVLVLPASCGLVGQMVIPGGKDVPLNKLLDDMPMPDMGENKAQMMQQMTSMLVGIVDKVGNIRVDGITFGLAGDFKNEREMFIAAVGRGQYDKARIKQVFADMGKPAETIYGIDAVRPDREFVFLMPSDHQIVLLGGPSGQQLPVEEVAAALSGKRIVMAATGPASQPWTPGLAGNAEMMKLVRSVKPGLSIWAVARMSETYRSVPLFKPFDLITLEGQQVEDTLKLKLVAQGQDPQEVQQAVTIFNNGLAEAKKDLGEVVLKMPPLKPIADFLNGLQVETVEKTVTVTGELKGMNAPVGGFMMLFAGRSMAVQQAQVEMAEPVQTPPAE